jgi:hypothetical protein
MVVFPQEAATYARPYMTVTPHEAGRIQEAESRAVHAEENKGESGVTGHHHLVFP